MQTSLFIAKIVGPMLVVPGLIGLANPGHVKTVGEEFLKSPALIFMAGAMALIAGLAVVNTHAVWTGWPLIITLMGWIMVAAGVLRMGFPGLVASMGQSMIYNEPLLRGLGALQVVLGAFVMWKAYF